MRSRDMSAPNEESLDEDAWLAIETQSLNHL